MRANRSPQRDGGTLQRRPPVPTIRELDENGDENGQLIGENYHLSQEFSVDNAELVHSAHGREGHDEGDGPLPSRRDLESAESVQLDRLNTSPTKHSQGGSFERLIQSLFVRAQITVFLMDSKSLDFIPATGYDCRCPEIIDALIKARNLDHAQARKAFSVWFTNSSDALEVQLKPVHNPFIIQKYWNYFLRRYADVNRVGKEVPLVYVRRSLWLSLDSEKQLSDHRVLQLLFEEARLNFLNERYYLSRDDVLVLGCLLIYKDHGRCSANPQHLAVVRKNLPDYFPAGIIPSQLILFRKNQHEEVVNDILNLYQGISARNRDEVRSRFLFLCRENPLYGAVFFSGVVEAPPKSRISEIFAGSAEVRIWVAVTEKGFFILSAFHKKDIFSAEILLALSHKEMMFECKEPSEKDALRDFDMSCLDITMSVPLRGLAKQQRSEEKRILRIFSKQAPLMAACLGTFIHTVRAAEFCRRDNIIDGVDIPGTPLTASVLPEVILTVSSPEIPSLTGRGKTSTVKTAKSAAFPDLTNHFDAFFLRPISEI